MTDIEQRVSALEEQVGFLLKGRPGRRVKPVLVSEEHVCGIDPDRDSASCADASLWRRSKGCKGDACVALSSEYYRNYRAQKRIDAEAEVTGHAE